MTSSAAPNPLFPSLRVERNPDGQSVVKVSGAWNLRSIQPVARTLRQQLTGHAPGAQWDLSAVSRLDHAGAMMLWHAWGKQRTGHLQLRSEHEIFFAHLEAGPTLADKYGKRVERRRSLWVPGRAVVTA